MQYLNTITVEFMDLEKLFAFAAGQRAAQPEYASVDDGQIYDAYRAAKADNLRYNRAKDVLRGNRLGVIQSPCDKSDIVPADIHETRAILMREIWGDAVQAHNVRAMA